MCGIVVCNLVIVDLSTCSPTGVLMNISISVLAQTVTDASTREGNSSETDMDFLLNPLPL